MIHSRVVTNWTFHKDFVYWHMDDMIHVMYMQYCQL